MTTNLGLNDYEFHFTGGAGLDFGVGHFVDVMAINGLSDLEVLYSDQQHLLQHGDIPGVHLAVAKLVTLDLEIRKATQTDTQWRDLIREVEDAFTIIKHDEAEFHWKFPGETERFLRARPVRRRRIIDPDSELGICQISVELRAADPRYYTATKKTDNTNTGTFNVVAEGTVVSYPKITFATGAGNTRAMLTHNDTGLVLDIQNGYSVSQNGFADMDKYIRGDQGLIIYDHAGVNKYGAWQPPRAPFYLNPGNNSLTLNFAQSVSLEWWDSHI